MERATSSEAPSDVVSRPPEIWLGDAVRAMALLKTDDATAITVMRMLGLVGAASSHTETDNDETPVAAGGAETPRPANRGVCPVASPQPVPATAPTAGLAPAVMPVVDVERRAPTSPPLRIPSLLDVLPEKPEPLDQSSTLLPTLQQRAIVSSMSALVARVGEVDIDALVTLLSERKDIVDIPLLPARTGRRGLQLLLDFGEGMRGFQSDRDEVWAVVSNVAGADGLEVLRFAGSPVDEHGAGPGPKPTWRTYIPPPAGRPVLVVSDLGTGPSTKLRHVVVEQWRRAAGLWRTAGNPVTALVPTPIDRVDRSLRGLISVVQWDRSTSVRDATKAARSASRRLPAEVST